MPPDDFPDIVRASRIGVVEPQAQSADDRELQRYGEPREHEAAETHPEELPTVAAVGAGAGIPARAVRGRAAPRLACRGRAPSDRSRTLRRCRPRAGAGCRT